MWILSEFYTLIPDPDKADNKEEGGNLEPRKRRRGDEIDKEGNEKLNKNKKRRINNNKVG